MRGTLRVSPNKLVSARPNRSDDSLSHVPAKRLDETKHVPLLSWLEYFGLAACL